MLWAPLTVRFPQTQARSLETELRSSICTYSPHIYISVLTRNNAPVRKDEATINIVLFCPTGRFHMYTSAMMILVILIVAGNSTWRHCFRMGDALPRPLSAAVGSCDELFMLKMMHQARLPEASGFDSALPLASIVCPTAGSRRE